MIASLVIILLLSKTTIAMTVEMANAICMSLPQTFLTRVTSVMLLRATSPEHPAAQPRLYLFCSLISYIRSYSTLGAQASSGTMQ